jgi:hypothetical protein
MNNPSEHGMGRPEHGGSRQESGGTMGAVKEKVQEWGSTVAGGAQQAWDATSRQTREWAGDVARTAENAWEGFGNTVRRYPVASLLIAFGVGFVLGGGLSFGFRRSNLS